MRRKPSPKRFVAERHIGEAVELGRGYKARTPQAFFWQSLIGGYMPPKSIKVMCITLEFDFSLKVRA